MHSHSPSFVRGASASVATSYLWWRCYVYQSVLRLASVVMAVGLAVSCGDDGSGKLTDAPGSPDIGESQAMLVLDRTSASYGSVTLGSMSPPTVFTVTNTGAGAS